MIDEVAIFVLGCIVTAVVTLAVALLVWGAEQNNEDRDVPDG